MNAPQVADIVRYTANTWQPGRSDTEKLADAMVGKTGELAFQEQAQALGLACRLWDDIRSDDNRNHAPCDCFIAADESPLYDRRFAKRANAHYANAHFVPGFTDWCEANGIYSVETKTTRLRDGFDSLETVVQNRHFIAYPSVRSGDLTPELTASLMAPDALAACMAGSASILFRSYIKDKTGEVFVLRGMSRQMFYGSEHLKLSKLGGQSKHRAAIYYLCPMHLGFPLTDYARWIKKGIL